MIKEVTSQKPTAHHSSIPLGSLLPICRLLQAFIEWKNSFAWITVDDVTTGTLKSFAYAVEGACHKIFIFDK